MTKGGKPDTPDSRFRGNGKKHIRGDHRRARHCPGEAAGLRGPRGDTEGGSEASAGKQGVAFGAGRRKPQFPEQRPGRPARLVLSYEF